MMQGAFRLEGTAETSEAVDVGVCAASSFTERSFLSQVERLLGCMGIGYDVEVFN